MAVCAAMRPKPFQARLSCEQLAVLGVLLLGLGLILLVVEDLEQQLVADLGLEVEAVGVDDGDFLALVPGRDLARR